MCIIYRWDREDKKYSSYIVAMLRTFNNLFTVITDKRNMQLMVTVWENGRNYNLHF